MLHCELYGLRRIPHGRARHSEFLGFGIEFAGVLADGVGRLTRREADPGAVNFSVPDIFSTVADRDVATKSGLTVFLVFF
jgi:hypothetical protein